jgi:hypothetical protein
MVRGLSRPRAQMKECQPGPIYGDSGRPKAVAFGYYLANASIAVVVLRVPGPVPFDRSGAATTHLTWPRASAIVVLAGKREASVSAAGVTAPLTVLTVGYNARWRRRDSSLSRLVPAPRLSAAARRSTAAGRRRTCSAYAGGLGRSQSREPRSGGRRDDPSVWALAGGSQGSAEAIVPPVACGARSPPLALDDARVSGWPARRRGAPRVAVTVSRSH